MRFGVTKRVEGEIFPGERITWKELKEWLEAPEGWEERRPERVVQAELGRPCSMLSILVSIPRAGGRRPLKSDRTRLVLEKLLATERSTD